MAVTRKPFQRWHPGMADPRSRETAALKLSEQRKRLVEARLAQGIEGFCAWCQRENVLAWPLVDQSVLLGLVLAKHGKDVRDMVRDTVL